MTNDKPRMRLLLPLGWLYGFAMLLRNKLFDWGVLKCESVGVPVISVGNLSVGGTGKTPLVEYIVQLLIEKKKHVAVVSRGYKRKSSGVVVVSDGKRLLANAAEGGDEPVQIARKFPDAIVVVGERRVDAAKKAVALGADVILLDDGFQHRYLKRDLDIVVVDATNDITKDAVLPAGRMREPLGGLRRASLVAFSNVDETVLSTPGGGRAQFTLDSKLRPFYLGPFVKYCYRVQDVRRANDGVVASLGVVKRMQLLAFSGIGKNEAFMHELKKNGFAPISDMRFSDHHDFSEGDVATIASFAKAMNADACITTEKNIVRLRASNELAKKLFDEIPVFYLTIEVEMLESKEVFHSLIDNCTRQ